MKLLLLWLTLFLFRGALGAAVCGSSGGIVIIALSTAVSFLPAQFQQSCSNLVPLIDNVSHGYFATFPTGSWSAITSVFSQGCEAIPATSRGIWINGPVMSPSSRPATVFLPPISPSFSSTTPTYSSLQFIACAYVTVDSGTNTPSTVTVPAVTTVTQTTTTTSVFSSIISFFELLTSTNTLTSVTQTTRTTQITETITETFTRSSVSASTTSIVSTSFSLTTTSTTTSRTTTTLTTLTTSVTEFSTDLTTDTTFTCPSNGGSTFTLLTAFF